MPTPLLYVPGSASRIDIDTSVEGFRRAGVQNVRSSIVPDAGHFLADDQPQALWALLSEFAAP